MSCRWGAATQQLSCSKDMVTQAQVSSYPRMSSPISPEFEECSTSYIFKLWKVINYRRGLDY